MDKYLFFAPNFLSGPEYLDTKNNKTCVGCGTALAVRLISKAVENYIDEAAIERPGSDKIFKGQSDLAVLKIVKGSSQILICLDDEPAGDIDNAIKKAIPDTARDAGLKYVATACPSYPFDMIEKVKKALKVDGKSYIHVLCPCPSGWDFDTSDTVKLGYKAVESLAFPLYEVEDGQVALTNRTLKPRQLSDYLSAQKRFSKVGEDEISAASATVEKAYSSLLGTA